MSDVSKSAPLCSFGRTETVTWRLGFRRRQFVVAGHQPVNPEADANPFCRIKKQRIEKVLACQDESLSFLLEKVEDSWDSNPNGKNAQSKTLISI